MSKRVEQYAVISFADYIGCFLVGAQPYTEPGHKFYEPQHTHVQTYPAYAYGPTYVLSNHVCCCAFAADLFTSCLMRHNILAGCYMDHTAAG